MSHDSLTRAEQLKSWYNQVVDVAKFCIPIGAVSGTLCASAGSQYLATFAGLLRHPAFFDVGSTGEMGFGATLTGMSVAIFYLTVKSVKRMNWANAGLKRLKRMEEVGLDIE